ncbi:MAG: ATP-binding protein [Coriobacteriia bacterium]
MILIVVLYVAIGAGLVIFVRGQLRGYALDDARGRAEMLITRNLAIHTYFSQERKPELFELADPILVDGSFQPSWMSSTYAVRRITSYADTGSDRYYYKECAIDARSPENEADEYEAEYLRALNADPSAGERSGIRTINGEQVFYLMRRGEVMEESCLRCHSTPEAAPAELVAYYGSDRSFGRQAGEVVSALSIRIPIAFAYAKADTVAARMSGALLGLFVIVMAVFFMLTRSMLVRPIQAVSAGAREMQSGTRPLSEGVRARGPMEIRELGETVDALALDLDRRITQLEAASAETQAAGATRDRFLANLSHELRTPLNAIIGYAGAMKMELAGPLSGEQLAQVDTIYDSGKHLLSLVEELLEYTVLDAGVVRVNVTRFAPYKAVNDVVRLFRPLAAEKGIELHVAERRCDFELHSDRFKFEQILINLLGNAIKFTEQGSITVTPSRDDGYLRIDVADTGVGIPSAELDAVFEKFTQLQAGGASKPAGTGLGLAITREYVRLLGGDITVESTLGVGSTFTLRIPLVLERPGSSDDPGEAPPHRVIPT